MIENEKIQITEDVKESIERLYTPLSEAREEMHRRWHDPILRKKVADFLRGDIPDCLKDGPKALLCRPIASPNFESLFFLELAQIHNIDPVFIEYTRDKFVDLNYCKYHLGRIIVDHGTGRKGGAKKEVYNIIDFNNSRGKPITNINTTWNENLVEFHHSMLSDVSPSKDYSIEDISDWFAKNTHLSGEYYYLNYLALFICNGILFENFLLNPEELEFTLTKVIPSFDKLINTFGVQPLIVPAQPPKFETEIQWAHYPSRVANIIKSRMDLIGQ